MAGTEDLHPSALRVASLLESLGALGPFREFDVPTKTAADAATALGCDVGAIASTLVFMIDAQPVVVIKSGGSRTDVDRLRELLKANEVRQATSDEVRAATGQSIGGVSPVGWPEPLRTLIDDSLSRFERLWRRAERRTRCSQPRTRNFAESAVPLRFPCNCTRRSRCGLRGRSHRQKCLFLGIFPGCHWLLIKHLQRTRVRFIIYEQVFAHDQECRKWQRLS